MSHLLRRSRVSRLLLTQIVAGDSHTVDATGRLRISEAKTTFNAKQVFDNLPRFWDELLESGGGISAAYNKPRGSSIITATGGEAGTFTRQTYRRFNYHPGKSELIEISAIIQASGGGVGTTCQLGLFDDDNGLFFSSIDGVMHVVLRSSVSGSPVDTAFAQEDWNVDPMDGKGPSGKIALWDRLQLFHIDFQWLGSGRIRMSMVIDGQTHTVHVFETANVLTSAFMSTPNLPLRYQMITTAASSAATLECICSAVISEGGDDNNGPVSYLSTGSTMVESAAVPVIYALLGIRLKTTHIGATIKLISANVAERSGSKEFEWFILCNPTSVAGGGLTYNDEDNSAIQLAIGDVTNIPTGGFKTNGGHASSNQLGGNAVDRELESALRLGSAIDGTRDEILLCARPVSGANQKFSGSLTIRELT